ncbi:ATP-binding cassette domain-containing protein [Lactobacillus equicursoris]|uniref:ATP-binding cassette domain-containing protein n=1 Tax=Lactobacillus equicursoris TaxID=420645 RepID=UPI0012B37DC6
MGSLSNKEILVLLGTNGAGKTTTIKSILGLVETDNGKVLFHDRDVKADDFKKIHQESAALLENATNLVDELSLIDNFVYWGLMRGIAKTEALKRGTEILTRFGLTDKKDTPINELSRGDATECSYLYDVDRSPSASDYGRADFRTRYQCRK